MTWNEYWILLLVLKEEKCDIATKFDFVQQNDKNIIQD